MNKIVHDFAATYTIPKCTHTCGICFECDLVLSDSMGGETSSSIPEDLVTLKWCDVWLPLSNFHKGCWFVLLPENSCSRNHSFFLFLPGVGRMGEGQESCACMVTVCSAVQEETVSLGSTGRTRRYTECCLHRMLSTHAHRMELV